MLRTALDASPVGDRRSRRRRRVRDVDGSVTPGQTFTITAKINPSPPSCGNGADIWIDAGSGPIALARGGIGGGLWGFSGGAGGSAADSLGDVTHSGGHGGAGMFVGPAEETSPSAGGGGGGIGTEFTDG